MFRFRSIISACLFLAITVGVVMMSPVSAPSWTHVLAETAPRPVQGDRLFLKIDGVDGEATETDHVGDLAVQSFAWSESRSTDSSAKAQIKDFHIVTALDKSSPLLMRKSVARERIAKVTLTVRNSVGQDYSKWTLGDVFVTSFAIEDTWGQSKPKVTFDLNFGKIDAEYRPQLYTGGLGPAVKAGWDAKGG